MRECGDGMKIGGVGSFVPQPSRRVRAWVVRLWNAAAQFQVIFANAGDFPVVSDGARTAAHTHGSEYLTGHY